MPKSKSGDLRKYFSQKRANRSNQKKLLNDLYYGGTNSSYYGDTSKLTNFTYLPDLIQRQQYYPSPAAIKEWCKKDLLARFLVEILPMKALSAGFELLTKDDKPFEIWESLWKPDLERTDFWNSFLKAWVLRNKYGLGLLYFDTYLQRFQVIGGNKVETVDVDEFNEPTRFTVTSPKTTVSLDMDFTYWIRRDEEDEPKGISYLFPIWDEMVYIKWIMYSMCEASAAEGSKFLLMGLNDPKPNTITRLESKVQGMSSRKGLFYDVKAIPPEGIKLLDTNLSPVMPLHMSECYKQISLYTLVPEDLLTGIHAYRSGTQENVGSLLEAYALIQREAEDALIGIFSKMFGVPRDTFAKLKFKWDITHRMTPLIEEQLKLVKSQRILNEMQYKLLSEIREEEELPISAQMKQIIPPNQTRGITISVKGLERTPEIEKGEEEE